MANLRLYGPSVRIGLATVNHFDDWKEPTISELNDNPTNDPTGTIWDLTCALDQDNSTFNLADSETDDSLSFCQEAGAVNPTSYNPEVLFSAFRSTIPWVVSDAATFNTANLAFSLLAWRGVEYFAWMSVGEEPGEDFDAGQRVSLVRVATDFGVDEVGTGEMARINQTFAGRGDINWNYEIQA